MILAILPAAYLTVWVGLTDPPRIPIVMGGDYSYGIYIFAFPIQQALAETTLFRLWYLNMPAATLLSLLYAVFSWHYIEKRALGQKKSAVALVERFGAFARGHIRALRRRSRQEAEPANGPELRRLKQ
jgi:peptidoglycan/LPS O-acetylase OafA/YrhL